MKKWKRIATAVLATVILVALNSFGAEKKPKPLSTETKLRIAQKHMEVTNHQLQAVPVFQQIHDFESRFKAEDEALRKQENAAIEEALKEAGVSITDSQFNMDKLDFEPKPPEPPQPKVPGMSGNPKPPEKH